MKMRHFKIADFQEEYSAKVLALALLCNEEEFWVLDSRVKARE
jgi:hypothetical protein